MKKLYRTIETYHLLFIFVAYFLVNLLFMRPFWKELFFDNSKTGARYGEVFVAEWAMDKVYQNIISGRNPFARSESVLYPFGTDFTTTDSGNGFFFLFLRPFLSEHQSLSVIVAAGLFFANAGMYLLLRKLRISKLVSFLIGLAFGYMTFLMPRMGHLNYASIYVFPWFFLFGISLIKGNNVKSKLLSSFGIALFFVMTLYLNLYYFIMLLSALLFFLLYAFFAKRNVLFGLIRTNWQYFVLIILLASTFLAPWFAVLYETYVFEGLPKTEGWGGAIETSSDLFGYFIPSVYSYFLKGIAEFIGSRFRFAVGIFENFTYPGLIIILSYFVLIFLKFRKAITHQLWSQIVPFLFVSFSFFLLTLGPFLHILGKWGITLDEGVRIIIPLPFVIFHSIPFMSNIRIPGRFIVAFIFFSYIICAYLFDYLLKNKGKGIRIIFFFILITIFFIDHYFVITSPSPKFIPYGLYQTIKQDPDKVTVLEIPSTVRDGFTYFGSGDSLQFIEGQMIHTKPVLGGYLGRIPPFKRDYYQRNPFLGYIGRVIDTDVKRNGIIDKGDLINWQTLDSKRSLDAIDFLDLKYIILKDNEIYASTMSAVLTNLGFENISKDNFLSLWKRNPQKREFLAIEVGGLDDDPFLGAGWNRREDGFRYAWKNASVMFKVKKPRKFNLQFTASSFYENQTVDVYLNRKKVGSVFIPQSLTNFTLPLEETFVEGINTIYFRFTKTFRPAKVIPASLDQRQFSVKFTNISLTQ